MNKTYENIRKNTTGKGNTTGNTTGCLLDYSYFKENYKIIAIDLSKQQALDADPRAIQQINFTVNLDRVENTTIFFVIEQAKETVFGLFTRNYKSFVNAVSLNAIYSLIFISIKWHNTIV